MKIDGNAIRRGNVVEHRIETDTAVVVSTVDGTYVERARG